jgi:hypothetical protein
VDWNFRALETGIGADVHFLRQQLPLDLTAPTDVELISFRAPRHRQGEGCHNSRPCARSTSASRPPLTDLTNPGILNLLNSLIADSDSFTAGGRRF